MPISNLGLTRFYPSRDAVLVWFIHRIAWSILTTQQLRAPYPPQFAIFAKGANAQKLIIVSLNDTLSNLSEAESSVRDADFAAESARLTRAQILVQSGTSVLSIANQNPQNVLSLLR